MNKRIKRWAVVILSLVLIGSVGLRFFLTKNYLVKVIEESINSRVEIGDMSARFTGAGVEVKLSDVKLARRDEQADNGIAHDQRSKLEFYVISLDEMEFKLSLWELMFRKMDVDRLAVRGLHSAVVMYEDGSNSLDELFAEPKKKRKSKKSSQGFNAKDHEKLVTELREVVLRDGSAEILIDKSGLIIRVEDVNLDLSDIRVDPNALEVVNEARLKLACRAEIFSNAREMVKFGEMGLDGTARVRLFDPVSGEIDPDLDVDLDIADTSYISNRVPYVNALWKLAKRVEKFVDIGTLPDRAVFSEPRKVAASYKKGRIDLHQPVGLQLADWELALAQGCWLSSGDERHEFHAQMKTTKKLSGAVDGLLGKLSGKLRDEMMKDWFIDGKFTIKIQSEGELSDPKIRLENQIPDIKKLLKDEMKAGLLDFAIDQLQLEGDKKDDEDEDEGKDKKDKKDKLKDAAGDALRSLLEK